MIAKLAFELLGQVVGVFGERGKARQEWLVERASALQRSGTDEIITVVWFSPAVVAWFSPDRANAWIDTILGGNPEYVYIVSAITAAVFGLGKVNGRKT